MIFRSLLFLFATSTAQASSSVGGNPASSVGNNTPNTAEHVLIDDSFIASSATNQQQLNEYLNQQILERYSKEEAVDSLLSVITSEYIETNADAWYEVSLPREAFNVETDGLGSITTVYDQTLSQTHAMQTNVNLRPTLSGDERQNKRQFFKMDGSQRMISDIDLNGDIVTAVIVFRHNGVGESGFASDGLFGHNNGGFDKFAWFPNGNFAVSGGNANGGSFFIVPTQENANPNDPGKIHVVSVGWYGSDAGASREWCNGKLLATFQASGTEGSEQMTFGALNPNGVGMYEGDIMEYILFRNVVSDLDTRRLHEYLRRKWGADGWSDINIAE